MTPIYDSALVRWGNLSKQVSTEGVVTLVDKKGSIMAQLPLQFAVTGSGDSALCSWLTLAAQSLLADHNSSMPEITHNGVKVDHKDKIESGIYEVQVILGLDVGPAPGPHAKTTKQKAFIQSESDTVSHSSRSSRNGQSPWRLTLFQRDQSCLISGALELLEACHIVPFSLGDEFVSTVSQGKCELYSPANGLLLERNLHKLFDFFRLGIYCFQGKLFVHCFAVPEVYLKYHGREITFSQKILEGAPAWLPDVNCLKWQYTQCILTSFRRSYVPFPPLQANE